MNFTKVSVKTSISFFNPCQHFFPFKAPASSPQPDPIPQLSQPYWKRACWQNTVHMWASRVRSSDPSSSAREAKALSTKSMSPCGKVLLSPASPPALLGMQQWITTRRDALVSGAWQTTGWQHSLSHAASNRHRVVAVGWKQRSSSSYSPQGCLVFSWPKQYNFSRSSLKVCLTLDQQLTEALKQY